MLLHAKEDRHRRRVRDTGPAQDVDRSESLEVTGRKLTLLLASGDSGIRIRYLSESGQRVAEKMTNFCKRL